jgi:hypothetical protein
LRKAVDSLPEKQGLKLNTPRETGLIAMTNQARFSAVDSLPEKQGLKLNPLKAHGHQGFGWPLTHFQKNKD